ncbi:MAG: hypothetical protein ACOY94_26635 [Bacillota bacterium]
MEELDLMIEHVARAIEEQTDLDSLSFQAGKLSIWLRFVRLETGGEQEVLPALKVVAEALTRKALLYKVAEQVVLAVFGSEVTVVSEVPNLIIKLFDHKAMVYVPGNPPLEQEGQVFLKVTVYRYEPGLWQRLFGAKKAVE